MKNKYILVGAIIIILVIIGFFIFRNSNDVSEENGVFDENGNQVEAWAPESIDAKHQYEDGVHIIAGEVDLPTPCHILREEVVVMESHPEQVVINFTAEIIDEEEICAQVMTTNRFKVEFSASEEANISAVFNGVDIRLNIFDVTEDENLDEFEIDVKS